MKAVLDFITLPLSLPINPIWDLVITAIIGEIAYWVAFICAGIFGDSSSERQEIHWAVRIPLYFIIWLLACLIITIVNFVKEKPLRALLILGIIIAMAAALIVIILINRKRRKEHKEMEGENVK